MGEVLPILAASPGAAYGLLRYDGAAPGHLERCSRIPEAAVGGEEKSGAAKAAFVQERLGAGHDGQAHLLMPEG